MRSASTLDFPASRTERNKCFLFMIICYSSPSRLRHKNSLFIKIQFNCSRLPSWGAVSSLLGLQLQGARPLTQIWRVCLCSWRMFLSNLDYQRMFTKWNETSLCCSPANICRAHLCGLIGPLRLLNPAHQTEVLDSAGKSRFWCQLCPQNAH